MNVADRRRVSAAESQGCAELEMKNQKQGGKCGSIDMLIDGLNMAKSQGQHVSAISTGSLYIQDGIYCLSDTRFYHPLERVLAGERAFSDPRGDLAIVLDVDGNWISGFLDGFASEPRSQSEREYNLGFSTANRLRASFLSAAFDA